VRVSSRLAVTRDQALVELGKVARELLLQVASTYRATITYHQLGVETQRKAGIRAVQSPDWLHDVLDTVVHVCHKLPEPPLTSLVVDADGHVGAPYDEVLRTEGLPVLSDPLEREQAAAASRLECYRRFAPHVPYDATPILVTPAAAHRAPVLKTPVRPSRTRAASGTPAKPKPAKPMDASRPRRDPDEYRAARVLCSSCFLQSPPGAECQNCGAPLK